MALIRSRYPDLNKLSKIALLFIYLVFNQKPYAQVNGAYLYRKMPDNPDVLGVTIGMTMQQAEEALGRSYKFMPVPPVHDNPETEEVYAIASGEVVGLETYRGKMIFINHLQIFTNAAKPNPVMIHNDLDAKYGPAVAGTTANPTFGIGSKMYNRDCDVATTTYYETDPRVLRMAGIPAFHVSDLGFPDLNRETGACGTVIATEISDLSLKVMMHNIDEPLHVIAEKKQQDSMREMYNQDLNKPKY